MASRGTMGLRMSRIMVDGLLNNTTYCRAFPSDTVRAINAALQFVDWTVLADTLGVPSIPSAYLYSSIFRVKYEVKCNNPAFRIDTEIYVNGLPAGYTNGYTGDTWHTVTFDIPGLQAGDLVSVWSKVGVGESAFVQNLSMNCTNEGIIEAVGFTGAW